MISSNSLGHLRLTDGMSLYDVCFSELTVSCRTDDYDLLASEITDKTSADVAEYYPVFLEKWKTLSEYPRIAERIAEGEQKRNKLNSLEEMLSNKISSVRYPMQELELNYPTTKGKIYSEEEDRYLLCRLHHYGLKTDDVYERIKKDILEFPVFRFDWFFKSRTPQELQRRCNTLLGLIEKEVEQEVQEERARTGTKGRKRALDDDAAKEEKEEKKEKPEKKEKATKSGKATSAASRTVSRAASPTPASTTGSAAGSGGGAKRATKRKKT